MDGGIKVRLLLVDWLKTRPPQNTAVDLSASTNFYTIKDSDYTMSDLEATEYHDWQWCKRHAYRSASFPNGTAMCRQQRLNCPQAVSIPTALVQAISQSRCRRFCVPGWGWKAGVPNQVWREYWVLHTTPCLLCILYVLCVHPACSVSEDCRNCKLQEHVSLHHIHWIM